MRLTPYGYQVGLIDEKRYQAFLSKKAAIEQEIARVRKTVIRPSEKATEIFATYGSTPIQSGVHLSDLIKRPEFDYEKLAPLDTERPVLAEAVREQVNIQIKYEGYIHQQMRHVEQFAKLEEKVLPEDMDYLSMQGLRLEAQQKLDAIRPASIGQASRITGVSPADVSVLLVYLEQRNRRQKEESK